MNFPNIWRTKNTHFLPIKLTKSSNAFGNFFEEGKIGPLSDLKTFSPNFLNHCFQSHFFLLILMFVLFSIMAFSVSLKSSMFGLACSKFGLKIWVSCSKCSKFGVSMFEVFEVRYFDVRSTSSNYGHFKLLWSSVASVIQKLDRPGEFF